MFSVAFYLPVRSGGQLPTALCRPRQRRPPEQIACRDEAAPQGRSPLLSTTSASLATRPTLSRPPWADWSMDASVPNPSFSRPTVQSPTGPPSAGRPLPRSGEEPTPSSTALARLAHTSHQIVIKGQSYRKEKNFKLHQTRIDRMTTKRFIVYLATDIPADGGPLACYLTSGKGLRILSIISAAGGEILLAHLGEYDGH